MRKVTYNSQRNNQSVFGQNTFSAWCQCFSTCAVMLMSYFSNNISGDDDEFLAKYVGEMDDQVNKAGYGEAVAEKLKIDPHAHSSYYFAIQEAGITKFLDRHGYAAKSILQMPFSELPALVKERPCILSTNKLGGLPDGHMILLCDYDENKKAFPSNDPFGNANTNYADTNGESVLYGYEMLRQVAGDYCNILTIYGEN